jgi:SUMO ligase MMS21 Smc5/6 complex component
LLDINYFHIGTIDIGNSYAALQHMLPESQRVNYEIFAAYLTDFHLKMMTIVKEGTKTCNLTEDGVKVSSVDTSVTSNEMVSQGIEKLIMEVNLYVNFTRRAHYIWKYKFRPNRVAHIKIIFNMTLVQSDKYWFVYDPLPDYKIDKQYGTLK